MKLSGSVAAAALLALAFSGSVLAAEARGGADFDAAIDALCTKDVVLLGEDAGHSGGDTVRLKSDMVVTLVERCGFSALYFESPVYEFLRLEERLARGDADPQALADAVGGLWAGTREFQPLLHWAWKKADAGALRLRGLDLQVGGSTQYFSEQELPARLARHAGPDRENCEHRLEQLTQWSFDADRPYDDAARQGLRTCLSAIEAELAGEQHDEASRFTRHMAGNLQGFLDLSEGDRFNRRDAAMAHNLIWHRARSQGERAIVWTATTHAAKAALPAQPDRVSLGMHLEERLGDSLASIGFTAMAGRHGRPSGPEQELAAPAADSLEAMAGSIDAPIYLDAPALQRLGMVEARVAAYARPQRAEWGQLLDGVWILPVESPLHPGDE